MPLPGQVVTGQISSKETKMTRDTGSLEQFFPEAIHAEIDMNQSLSFDPSL